MQPIGMKDTDASPKPRPWWRALCVMLAAMSWLLLLQVIGGFVGVPPRLLEWFFTADETPLVGTPRYVVVLGGGGIPSESGLMRTYYAAHYGAGKTGIAFIVSLPADRDPATSSVGRMRDELVLRGVPADAVQMEYRALNTHAQAVNVRQMLGDAALKEPILIVTSPTHARRALLCFRKQGFTRATCLPAHNVSFEADPGRFVKARYSFWSNLELQIELTRESCAMAFYRLRGWI